MASTGSAYIFDSMRTRKGQTLVIGRIKTGHEATIEARDLDLKQVRAIMLTPYAFDRFRIGQGSIGSLATNRYDRTFESVTGSIGSVGSLNNYVKIRHRRMQTLGSITMKAAAAQGTRGLYIGTKAGSFNSNFIAWGR